MKRETAIIKAEKVENGYTMICITKGDIEYPTEGRVVSSRMRVYEDASAMYPFNSTWQGRKIHSGYRIVVD